METAAVVAIASGVVSIVVAIVTAMTSDAASKRSSEASEAAADRVVAEGSKNRAWEARGDLRERRAEAYRQVLAALTALQQEGQFPAEHKRRREELSRLIADARLWAGPQADAVLWAIANEHGTDGDPVSGEDRKRIEATGVREKARDVLVEAAQLDLRETYPPV